MNQKKILKFIDSTVGSLLCRAIGLYTTLNKAVEASDITSLKIRRILLIRPGGMGDMIMLLPVIKALQEKYPEAKIDLVCEKRNMDVLKLAGLENNALVYDVNPVKFFFQLKQHHYDIALDTEQFHHFSAVFAFWSGAPVRIGFKINPRRNPLYTHLIPYAIDGYEAEQFARIPEPLGISDIRHNLENILTDTDSALIPSKMLPSSPFVIINPGASTHYKMWNENKYVQLASWLQKNRKLNIVLTGSRKEQKICTCILNALSAENGNAVSLVGELGLKATAALMKRAELFIGSDSGLAHLAMAMGLPTVVLFGPSDRRKWGVEDKKHAIVLKNLPCSPCFMFGSHESCRTIACMNEIGVDEVIEAVEKIIRAIHV
ncbi:glycosyltransferase family 9 protein [Verrucomicrobiota bacterium]